MWQALERLKRKVRNRAEDVGAALDEVIELRRGLLADDHVMSALTTDLLITLGVDYVNTGPLDEQSHKLFAEVLQMCRSNDFLNSRKAGSGAYWVAHHLEFRGKYVEGERAARESITFVQPYEGLVNLSMGPHYSALGGNLRGRKRFVEAQRWLLDGYQILLDEFGPRGPDTRAARSRLIELYGEWGRPKERAKYVMPVLRELLDRKANAGDLNRWIWSIVQYPDLGSDAYALGLEAAERTVSFAPVNANILNTLGVAQYRAGSYHEALDTLLRCDELNGGTSYADVAFLAMTHHHLGNAHEAQATLPRVSDLVHVNQSLQGKAFLREAEQLIVGKDEGRRLKDE